MKNILQKELEKIKTKHYLNQEVNAKFRARLGNGRLIRAENPQDHCCTFFVPLDRKTNKIYICHHINANQWIPPGGHIEVNEKPLNTVKREFWEELGVKIDDSQIELFDIGITDVQDKKRSCKIHYDFWYLVHSDQIDFKYDRREFYQARWLTISEALQRIRHKTVINSLNNLKNSINWL